VVAVPNDRVRGLDDDSWLFLCQFTNRGEDQATIPSSSTSATAADSFHYDHREDRCLADCS
jgi:hypothetical protein